MLGLDDLDLVSHEASGERSWATEVRHRDGRRWRVVVRAEESEAQRPESCGKPLKPMTWFARVVR